MSEFGGAFDACQRAHDNAEPPSDWPDGPTCEECQHEMTFTEYKKTRRFLVWRAVCPECKAVQHYDSAED